MKRQQIDGGSLTLDGRTLPIDIRINPRARRLILRLERPHTIRVTCPSRRHIKDALAMVAARRSWIADRLREAPAPVPFTPGAKLPILGTHYTVCPAPDPRQAARIEGTAILTGGKSDEGVARRIETCLRKLAADTCRAHATELAQQAGVTLGTISVRQMTSRWGSCAASGNLSFNWRLIFAPPWVLRYVVAHEVAHRHHMDHSPAFWAVVSTLDPDYQTAEEWLRDYGVDLHAYGQPALPPAVSAA